MTPNLSRYYVINHKWRGVDWVFVVKRSVLRKTWTKWTSGFVKHSDGNNQYCLQLLKLLDQRQCQWQCKSRKNYIFWTTGTFNAKKRKQRKLKKKQSFDLQHLLRLEIICLKDDLCNSQVWTVSVVLVEPQKPISKKKGISEKTNWLLLRVSRGFISFLSLALGRPISSILCWLHGLSGCIKVLFFFFQKFRSRLGFPTIKW